MSCFCALRIFKSLVQFRVGAKSRASVSVRLGVGLGLKLGLGLGLGLGLRQGLRLGLVLMLSYNSSRSSEFSLWCLVVTGVVVLGGESSSPIMLSPKSLPNLETNDMKSSLWVCEHRNIQNCRKKGF